MKNNTKNKIVVVLDNVRSALNVGSIFRTADSLGVDEVVLCGITATPPSKEIHKTALGAELSVKWRKFENTTAALNTLKEEGCRIAAIEQSERSVDLTAFHRAEGMDYAFVLGNEVEGVNSGVLEMCDEIIEIEQKGIKKSLNVSVAGGIVLWEVTKAND
ncbi:MAG: RNA methyltransferase [Rikenellaceae bacterium]